MRLADVPAQEVVQAARDGDPAALDELVSGYLPLVYNVVGRAADADLDVDDIVQDTMLHVVDGLPGLRDAASARSWVLAIAVRQLTDARRRAKARRSWQVAAAPVPLAQVSQRSQWQFYAGALQAWVNVFMPYQSGTIMYQVGGSPYGPWSTARTAGTTPGGPTGSSSASAATANYALFAHPEYAQDGGPVEYLSYFRPGDGSQQLVRLQFADQAAAG